MYDIVESGNIEVWPLNGHVIFFGIRRPNLTTGRIEPATGLVVQGYLADEPEDADAITDGAPVTPVELSTDLTEAGTRGDMRLYLGAIPGEDLDAALPEDDYPDGTKIYEVVISGTAARRVTELTVRRVRKE